MGRPIEKRGRVWRQLRSAVMTGGFPPGSLLPSERDLAGRFNTTRTTISRALKKLTDEGLLSCRPRIGYTVPPVVRNGRPVHGGAIGVVWEDMPTLAGGHAFFTALERAMADAGHTLMVAATGYDAERENEAIRRLQATGMEALIIAPACRGGRSTELERWIRDGRPVVLHGHPGRWLLPDALAGRCATLDSDNADGMRRLLELLAGLGHRAAGFVCQDSLVDSERFAAFERWSKEFGLTTCADWCLGDVGISLDSARAALTRLRAKDGPPPAIVCSHDDVALSLMDALAEAGLRCPEDVSVVGFGDNSVHGSAALSHLTTVKLDTERQTQETMRLLAKQFAGEQDAPEHVRIRVSLVDRGSAGTPRPDGDRATAIAMGGGSEEILLETVEK